MTLFLLLCLYEALVAGIIWGIVYGLRLFLKGGPWQ